MSMLDSSWQQCGGQFRRAVQYPLQRAAPE
jgi:hypothetical protein